MKADATASSGAREAAAIAALVAAALFWTAPLLRQPENLSHWDWDKEFALAATQRSAVIEHGELPLWNPHTVGGVPMLGFHESIAMAPTFPLVLAFGPVLGMKLRIVACCIAGVLLTYRLGRSWGLGPWSAAYAGSVSTLGGYLASHIWFGQPMWIATAFTPLVILGIDGRRPWLAALGFMLMFVEGGLDIQFMVFGASLVAVTVMALDRRPRGIATLVACCAAFAGAMAVKLLPTIHFIVRAPRPMPHGPGSGALHNARGLVQLRDALVSTRFHDDLPWTRGHWEDLAHIGLAAVLLAIAGALLLGRRRERLPWIVAAVACLVIAMDDGGIPGLWSTLHALPVIEQFEMPLRFAGVTTPILALLGGAALERLAALPVRGARILAAVLGATAAIAPLVLTRSILALVFWNPPPAELPRSAFHQWRAPTNYQDYPSVLMNRGNVAGLLATSPPVRVAAVGEPGYRGEAYLATGDGAVRETARTTCSVTLEVDAPAPARLVLNVNGYPGWRTGAGAALDHEGLVAFDVPAGRSVLRAAYQPFDVRFGLFVSLCTVSWFAATHRRKLDPQLDKHLELG